MDQQQEQLLLGQKERDRLKVLHEVQRGHVSQRQAAEQLGLSERWIREMLRRVRAGGDAAVVHGLRGKRSARRLAPKLKEKALRLYRKHYSGFGPTLAAEYLLAQHGIRISKETLRGVLVEAGLWKAKPRRLQPVHVWRQRRSCCGELVQWDTSTHDWLEGRSPEPVKLIAMIDDAHNALWARFVAHDSTTANLEVLRGYLQRHGRPQAFYTDKAGLFLANARRIGYGEERTQEAETQIGRALRELRIELIHAHSPQAKGRVERCFGTLQDRLVKGLRLACVETIEGANRYLDQTFLPDWKRRFQRKPASAVDAHRPLPDHLQLDSVLAHVEPRQVANDYTVSWGGSKYQIPREQARAGLRRSKVRIEQWLDGSLHAALQKGSVELALCGAREPEPAPLPPSAARKDHNRGGRSSWMQDFHLQRSPPQWKAAQDNNGSP